METCVGCQYKFEVLYPVKVKDAIVYVCRNCLSGDEDELVANITVQGDKPTIETGDLDSAINSIVDNPDTEIMDEERENILKCLKELKERRAR